MTLAVFKLALAAEAAYASYVSGRTNAGFARAAADEVPGLLDAAAVLAQLLAARRHPAGGSGDAATGMRARSAAR